MEAAEAKGSGQGANNPMTPSTVQATPAPLSGDGIQVQDLLKSGPKGLPEDNKSLKLWFESKVLTVADFQEYWPDKAPLFDMDASF